MGAFRLLLVSVLVTFVAGTAAGRNESGLPIMHHFAARDYRAHNQTWASLQDTDGVMYFGNRNGILRYDGAQWSLLPVPGTTFVRGLALAVDRTLYAGAVNQLGYFAPAGERSFVSLLDKLPADRREFGPIWSVSVFPDGAVGFLGDTILMVWHEGRFDLVPVTERAIGSQDAVYLPTPDGTLARFEGGRFVTVARDAFFKDTEVVFIESEADGSLLIGSRQRGLFRLHAGQITPVPTDIDDHLAKEGLRAGQRLPDGSLALSTRQTGALLLDRDNRLLCRLDNRNALPSTTVRAFTPDREGGLWLSHNNGVTRLEWPSALTAFGKYNGLGPDFIRDLVRHDGTLYTVTSGGAFYLGTEDSPVPNAMFRPVINAATREPFRTGFRGLLPTAHGLLAGSERGLFVIERHTARAVFDPGQAIITLAASARSTDRVYLGLDRGLQQLRWENGAWIDHGYYPGIQADIRSVVEDADGTLWASGAARGFYRITQAENPAQARVENITGGRGLPASVARGFVYVMSWRRRPLFCLNEGLYTYDATTDRFDAITEVGARLARFNVATQGTDSPDHLWLRTYAKGPGTGQWHDRRIWQAGVDGSWKALPYLAADIVDDSRIFREERVDGRHVLWIPGTEVLLRVDLDAAPFASHPLPAPHLSSPFVSAGGELPYKRGTLTFRHVTPTFRQRALTEYQVQMTGLHAEPQPWSEDTESSFANLPAGRYVFRVQARNSDGVVSAPAELAFTILSPWWWTPWAWAAYATATGAAIAGIVRWRVATLKRRNLRLETTVEARTAELRMNETMLRQARDAAEAASRAKSVFLANMSHELRTPLNAILGYARILHQDDSIPAAGRQRAGVINESGSHLLSVINDVLDLSKIEAGKLTLHPADFSLQQMLAGVVATFQALAFEKGLEFKAHFAPDLPDGVFADEHRLRQVLFNLLSNAVKFTQKGSITLSGEALGDTVRFSVADSGSGISAGQLQMIFQPFQQAHGGRSSQQGTGLGLTISQRIVELLGGRLEVTSKPGVGSRFWFDIPLPRVELPTISNVRPVAGYHGPRRRLLLVDDEAVNRDVLRGLLQPLGFEIHESTCGADCLAQAVQLLPDAILLDLRMPGLDGFSTARQLRALPGGDRFIIIAVSASVFEENRQDAINAGCDEFLPKPIQLERMLGVLQAKLRLQWTHVESVSLDPFTVIPDAGVLDELHQLSLSGEIEALRRRLDRLAQDEPCYSTFARVLDTLAARFQMKRIREILLAQKQRRS